MSTYETFRTNDGATAVAGRIGNIFISGFRPQSTVGAAPVTFLFTRFGQMIVETISLMRDWNDARLTRKSLDALSDRELDDIGLSRGDIDTIAAFRR